MAQGRPPRRSKGKRDPVKIDAKAEDVTARDGGKAADAKASTPGDAAKSEAAEQKTPPAVKAGQASATPPSGSSPSGASGVKPAEAAEKAAPANAARETASAAASGTKTDEKPSTGSGPAAGAASTGGGERAQSAGPKSGPAAQAGKPGSTTGASSRQPPPPRPNASGGGPTRSFVAGLLGGVVAVGVLFMLQEAHVLPVPGQNDAADARAQIGSLGSQVQSLKQTVSDLQGAATKGGDNSAVKSLEQQVKALSEKVDAMAAATSSSGGVDSSAFDALQGTVAKLQSSGQDLAGRVDDLSKTVDALASKVSSAGSQVQLVRAIAATALKSAIDRGGPFAAELQAYANVAPDDAASGELKQLASAGVPSREQLKADFPKAADAILAATRGVSGDSNVFDRLLASARSLVKVRPTGNLPGDTPEAIVARMEVKLKAGNLKGMVDEWGKLPEAGKTASQSFIDAVRARLKAETLASEALKQAMPATGSQG